MQDKSGRVGVEEFWLLGREEGGREVEWRARARAGALLRGGWREISWEILGWDDLRFGVRLGWGVCGCCLRV